LTPPKTEPPRAKAKPHPKSTEKTKVKDRETDRAALLSFKDAKERRDREREKSEAKEEIRREKEQAQVERALAKAEDALDLARKRHEEKVAAIEQDREKLDRRAASEKEGWEAERAELEEARERTTKSR
jgi:hypothetical protein